MVSIINQPTPEKGLYIRKLTNLKEIKMDELTRLIREAIQTLRRTADEIEKLSSHMIQENDITYCIEIANAIGNCHQNIRVPIMISKIIRIGKKEE